MQRRDLRVELRRDGIGGHLFLTDDRPRRLRELRQHDFETRGSLPAFEFDGVLFGIEGRLRVNETRRLRGQVDDLHFLLVRRERGLCGGKFLLRRRKLYL
ncbi:MAG: hypothetical protein NVS3B17_00370 [Vulcanimicrobiaceae bacterium]